MTVSSELIPCPVDLGNFNPRAKLPYGLEIDHISSGMKEFLDFLGFVNQQLDTKKIPRLEDMLMPANFSSVVGEFLCTAIPKYCKGLARNQYHNGHPDLIPADRFPKNSVQHTKEGIEVKASRYESGWQGHNPEDVWLMVFVFESNGPRDKGRGIKRKPFRFLKVVGARLKKRDWLFAGRSETSRRTITASVTKSGFKKMEANWIYKAPDRLTDE